MYADNVVLPTFTRHCCNNQSIFFYFPVRRAHSSTPAVVGLLLWAHTRTLYHFIDPTLPAYYVSSANNFYPQTTAQHTLADTSKYVETMWRISHSSDAYFTKSASANH